MKKLSLWMLEYPTGNGWGELVPLYCTSEDEAQERAAKFCINRNIPVGNTKLTSFPHGFVILHTRIPGSIEIDEE